MGEGRVVPGNSPPVVAFVTGSGRSGTTVLNQVLASEGALGLGEVRYVWERGIGMGQRCSCNNNWKDCPVWGVVIPIVTAEVGMSPIEAASRLGADSYAAGKFAAIGRTGRSYRARRYAYVLRRLYEEAARVANVQLVVDTSKDPAQALLARETGLPVFVLHWVRDPRGMVWSYRRKESPYSGAIDAKFRRPSIYAAGRWSIRNAFITSRVRPDLLLRYEDFVSGDAGAQKLQSLLPGLNEAKPIPGVGLDHAIAGNAVRFLATGEKPALTADLEWARLQPLSQTAVVTAVTAPLLRRYGYPLMPRSGDQRRPPPTL